MDFSGTLPTLLLLLCFGLLVYLIMTRTGPGTAAPQGIMGRLFGTPADSQAHIAALRARIEQLEQGQAPAAANGNGIMTALHAVIPSYRSVGGLPKWQPPGETFEQAMSEAIAGAVADMKAALKLVRLDPLFYQNVGHLWFILNSAISRHGVLIERAIFEALEHEERYQAWHDLMWTKPEGGKVQIDLIVHDKQTGMVRAYEVKRGWSGSDSDRVLKQSRVNLPAVKGELMSWASRNKIDCRGVETHFISYYAGKLSADGDMGATLNEHNINEHFGIEMREHVNHMTQTFKDAIEGYIVDEGLWADGEQEQAHGALDAPPRLH